VTPVVVDSSREVVQAFFAGRCRATRRNARGSSRRGSLRPVGRLVEILASRSQRSRWRQSFSTPIGMGEAGALGAVCADHGEEHGATRDNIEAVVAGARTRCRA